MKHPFLALLAAAAFSLSAQAQTSPKGPTMGWSSWNTYLTNINETLIKKQATDITEFDEALVSRAVWPTMAGVISTSTMASRVDEIAKRDSCLSTRAASPTASSPWSTSSIIKV